MVRRLVSIVMGFLFLKIFLMKKFTFLSQTSMSSKMSPKVQLWIGINVLDVFNESSLYSLV